VTVDGYRTFQKKIKPTIKKIHATLFLHERSLNLDELGQSIHSLPRRRDTSLKIHARVLHVLNLSEESDDVGILCIEFHVSQKGVDNIPDMLTLIKEKCIYIPH
jgi:hypothetical protein